MSPKYIIQFNAFPGIILYPKTGAKPELVKDKALHDRRVNCVYSPNGKVYFLSQDTMDTKGKRPFEIIELDLETKVQKIIYSAGQVKNNPFKVQEGFHNGDWRTSYGPRKLYIESETNNLIITNGKGSWKFNIKSGKWGKLPSSSSYNYSNRIGKNLLVSRKGNYFNLLDYSKGGIALKEFAKVNKVKEVYNPSGAFSLMRIRMREQRNNKLVYTNYLHFTDKNFWDKDKIIFFKQRMIFHFKKNKANAVFMYRGKLYCVGEMRDDKSTLKVYIGAFKDSEQLTKYKNKENSIIVESF